MCSSPSDDLHLIGKVKATTDRMAYKMALNVDQVYAAVRRMDKERDHAWQDLEMLIEGVLVYFRYFKELTVDPSQLDFHSGFDIKLWQSGGCYVQPHVESVESSYCDFMAAGDEQSTDMTTEPVVEEPIRKEEIDYLCTIDGSGLADQQPQVTLLKKAQKNLEDLVETADRNFTFVFGSLEAVEREEKRRTQYMHENREEIKREFDNLQETLGRLLKAHRGQSGLEVKY